MKISNETRKIVRILELVSEIENYNRDMNGLNQLSNEKIQNNPLKFNDTIYPEKQLITQGSQNPAMNDVVDKSGVKFLPNSTGASSSFQSYLDSVLNKIRELRNRKCELENKIIKEKRNMKSCVISVMSMLIIAILVLSFLAGFLSTRPMIYPCLNGHNNAEVAHELFLSKLNSELKRRGEILKGCLTNDGIINNSCVNGHNNREIANELTQSKLNSELQTQGEIFKVSCLPGTTNNSCVNDHNNREIANELFLSKLMNSELKTMLAQGEIFKVVCLPNDGTTKYFSPVEYFSDVSVVELGEIYSDVCGKNFTLVLYFGDTSNYTVYLAYFTPSTPNKVIIMDQFIPAPPQEFSFNLTTTLSPGQLLNHNHNTSLGTTEKFPEHSVALNLGSYCFILHYDDLILIGFYLLAAIFLFLAICVIVCGHICGCFYKRSLKAKTKNILISHV